jgi:cyclopropane-fatty-acyl-phospholipid synthase
MKSKRYQQEIVELLRSADVEIGGTRPRDIHINNEDFYERILSQGSLALGESYMEGWWDCHQLDDFFYCILKAQLDTKVKSWTAILAVLRAKFVNLQKGSRAYQIGKHHYDKGNKLYSRMLDKEMIYSCGYWQDAENLDQAQQAKMELVCRKLHLEPGMRVLDIGCGWGGMAKYAAEKYGVSVVGITVSREQADYARESCKNLPIEIRMQDYRELDEKFDRILSLGMFEHVGYKNYVTFMEVLRRNLKNDGLVLLHTIGNNTTRKTCDPWVSKYIFPNSMIPSPRQICDAFEGFFMLEDWHNFGVDYDKTLMAWHHNFENSWSEIEKDYDQLFFRMWRYYLLSCAGSFRARRTQLWQIILTPKGISGGYTCIR